MYLLSLKRFERISKRFALYSGEAKHILGVVLIISILLSLLASTGAGGIFETATISSSGTIYHPGYPSALHIDGRLVKNSEGQVVSLKGVNYAYFIDSPGGSWVLPDGSVAWLTWDAEAMAQNLEAMSSWGCNTVRTLATAEWWIDNTDGHRQHIKDWITTAEDNGIYVVYGFWRVTGESAQNPLPYPPYNGETNSFITSDQDFVDLWASVASELKDYPNVVFELWNEPSGDAEGKASWFSVVQQCITAIRATGAKNLIVVQWGYCSCYDFTSYPDEAGTHEDFDWIIDYPLTDPEGNILYSTHLYRNAFYDSSQGFKKINEAGWVNYTSNDLEWAYDLVGLTSITDKPLWVGEIGANSWETDLESEYTWFETTMSILNQHGIGYCGWWWWPLGQMKLLEGQANYEPSQSGTMLKNALR